MVCGNATAVCGWQQLLDANLIGAGFTMYNAAFIGWFVAILFFVYQAMLYYKTQNLTLNFVTGMIFLSMYIGSTYLASATTSIWVMSLILILELGAILYMVIWK